MSRWQINRFHSQLELVELGLLFLISGVDVHLDPTPLDVPDYGPTIQRHLLWGAASIFLIAPLVGEPVYYFFKGSWSPTWFLSLLMSTSALAALVCALKFGNERRVLQFLSVLQFLLFWTGLALSGGAAVEYAVYAPGFPVLHGFIFGIWGAVLSLLATLVGLLVLGASDVLFHTVAKVPAFSPGLESFHLMGACISVTMIVYLFHRGRIRVERSLRRTHEALEVEKIKAGQAAKLASIGELAATVAHEINNPLAVMSMILPTLEAADLSPDKRKDRVEKMRKAWKRIERISSSLRRFSRLQERAEPELRDMREILSESAVFLEAKAHKHNVELSVQVSRDCHLLCDPVEIEQVIINLVGNAIDAVKDKSEKWVRVTCEVKGDQLQMHVIDSGTGIPGDIRDRLFDPFFTTKPKGEGTGLGLPVVRQIVERHGGTVKVLPDHPNTAFLVTFPRAQAAAAAGAKAA